LPSEKYLLRLDHILDNIERIETYVSSYDYRRFEQDARCQDAVERCLARIAEAARKLGDRAERLAPEQPWPAIRAFGNRLRHDYEFIDSLVVWGIVTERLPSLKAAVNLAITKLLTEGEE